MDKSASSSESSTTQNAGMSTMQKVVIWGGSAFVGLTLASYLGVCAMAQNSDVILSNVKIDEVSVGGMNRVQAIDAVSQSLSSKIQATPVTLVQGGWNGVLQGDIALAAVEDAVDLALGVGRENFLTSGANYLTGVTGDGSTVTVPLSLNEDGQSKLNTLLDEADGAINGGVVQSTWILDVDNSTLWVKKGTSGVAVDRSDAESATLTALSSGTATQVALSTNVSPPSDLDFQEVRDEIYTPPVSAEIDKETLEVTAHILGVDLDVPQATTILSQASEGELVSAPLIITQPEETTNDVRAYLFADVLATSSTRVTGSSARLNNLRQSSIFCNDTVLLPGEVFSYQDKCMPYTYENGYQNAGAFVNGVSVSDIGGGVCQGSSTIYYAVLQTNLEVVERRNHSIAVSYLPKGMDATVYSTVTDFKFKNNTPYPIKLLTATRIENGAQYYDVTILGTKTDEGTIVPKSTVNANGSATLTRYHYDAAGELIKTEVMYTDTYRSSSSSGAVSESEPAPEEETTESEGETAGTEGETPPAEGGSPEASVPDSSTPDTSVPDVVVPETPEASTPEPSAPEASTPEPSAPAPEPVPEAVAPSTDSTEIPGL